MDDLLYRDATTTAAAVRAGEVSSRELTEALLARIDAVNPTLNAIVELRRDEALAEADRAGMRDGALTGVPMTVKEAYHVAGLTPTWGNPEFDGPAETDATVVARLRAAGAIIVGTTNVAFMLSDVAASANPRHGATANPWDPSRTPGGSSGGSAAAVAAGLSFLEYGSDLAGSIRVPAALCGVYGLRPTTGTVPQRGFQPPGPIGPAPDALFLGGLGPIARSAEDLRTALQATAGPESPMNRAYAWQLAPPRRDRIEGFRVGVVLDHPLAPVGTDVGAVLSDTVDGLARAGVRVVEGWPPGIDAAASAASFGFHVGMFFAFQGMGHQATLDELIEQEQARMTARAAWDAYFDDVDVFLCPATPTAAFGPDEHDRHNLGFWISPPSLPGLPTVAAPVGLTAAGLPVGVQLVGPRHEDDTAITFAQCLADLIGGYRRPPLSSMDSAGDRE